MTGFIAIVAVMVLAPIAIFAGGAIWSALMGDLIMHRVDAHADEVHPRSYEQ
jgi:hypothetical protein